MSLKSNIGPIHLISETATSHICSLKRTKNRGDRKSCVFLIKRVIIYVVCSMLYILDVKWLSGCSEVRDHEIYKPNHF